MSSIGWMITKAMMEEDLRRLIQPEPIHVCECGLTRYQPPRTILCGATLEWRGDGHLHCSYCGDVIHYQAISGRGELSQWIFKDDHGSTT